MALGASHGNRLVFVAGTRPEAVKIAPVILALRARGEQPVLVSTGQHGDLLTGALAAFGLAPDHDLAIMRTAQTPADVVGALIPALTAVFSTISPAAVVVQGDTATALAGALAAAYARIPVAHIEAGLRSGRDDPFPEEMHRKQIAQVASLHFAPTAAAGAALRGEGIAARAIQVTGNSGIDALHWMQGRIAGDPTMAAALAHRFAGINPARPMILATVHRRENHGAPLARIVAALADLARDAEIILPVHPNPAVAEPVMAALAGRPGVHLLPPLDYPAFVWLLQRVTLVVTDSGGVQEEGPALGVPVLVMRDVTERREGIDTGNALLVGTRCEGIVRAARGLLADAAAIARMSEPALPYGQGDAAARIAALLVERFALPLAIAAE